MASPIPGNQALQCWRRHIFPGRLHPSIVSAGELNCCVRNGNRWTLTAIGTNYFNWQCTMYNYQLENIVRMEQYLHDSIRLYEIQSPNCQLYIVHCQLNWWPVGESNSCLRRERPPSWPLDQRALDRDVSCGRHGSLRSRAIFERGVAPFRPFP